MTCWLLNTELDWCCSGKEVMGTQVQMEKKNDDEAMIYW